jgi:hypothetical protein
MFHKIRVLEFEVKGELEVITSIAGKSATK